MFHSRLEGRDIILARVERVHPRAVWRHVRRHDHQLISADLKRTRDRQPDLGEVVGEDVPDGQPVPPLDAGRSGLEDRLDQVLRVEPTVAGVVPFEPPERRHVHPDDQVGLFPNEVQNLLKGRGGEVTPPDALEQLIERGGGPLRTLRVGLELCRLRRLRGLDGGGGRVGLLGRGRE